jgi:glutamate synthase domain-containing protein 1
MNHNYVRDVSGCGLSGIIDKKRNLIPASDIIKTIALQHDRGNGLGGGFAGYGIYPEYADFYAFHIMYDHESALDSTEEFIDKNYIIARKEKIPCRKTEKVPTHPLLLRYFVKVKPDRPDLDFEDLAEDDFVVKTVMKINKEIEGAYIFSSGKNMGAFKGVGFPEDIAEFFMLEEYEAYIWTAHNRFPTNTPGWWGGAHPFTLLDWSIVHNGEISSYGINKRYLEMFGYECTLLTDTEVVAYLFDLLIRKHKLPARIACMALASPFWKDIDRMEEADRELLTQIRMVYGSAMLNGPFAILFGHKNGLIGFNDRIKLRPLVAATHGDRVFISSEEASIRTVCPEPDEIWAPTAGEPVIVELEEDNKKKTLSKKANSHPALSA